jgi:hypothetical protein
MWFERAKETLAMLMNGDGLLAIVEPRRHSLIWKAGPRFWQRMVEPFVEHPGMTRVIGAVGLGLGVWLASRQQPEEPADLANRNGASLRRAVRKAVGVS